MFSTLRTRFGIPGVISVIALVFAMIGGAYAANNASSGGKATASAKAKKGPRGPKGATGPAGPQGPAGPAGAKGDAGANGANGAAGATGPTGAKGTTGATGATGPEGSPWTDGGTLPSGQTETGTWAISEFSESFNVVYTAISFPIPLAAPGSGGSAFFFNKHKTEEEEFGASGCTGTVTQPTAPPGKLCVYTGAETVEHASFLGGVQNTEPLTGERYGASGAILEGYFTEGEAHIEAYGSWAVTAP